LSERTDRHSILVATGCDNAHHAGVFDAGTIGLIITALTLGFRHGFDWDHLAAITDVTSTTTTAEAAESDHEAVHERASAAAQAHAHAHGGPDELATHETQPDGSSHPHPQEAPRFLSEQRRALLLGSMYALGHAFVVAVLGTLALLFGAVLPDWVDDVMGPVVGATLLFLGIWVFVSLYQYARHGHEFRLRSRWMLVFSGVRRGTRWVRRRFGTGTSGAGTAVATLDPPNQGDPSDLDAAMWHHGHHGRPGHHHHVRPEHDDDAFMNYGRATAFGVGMIHGIGAETPTQVLIFLSAAGAGGRGAGILVLLAVIVGLLSSNSLITLGSAMGFLKASTNFPLYATVAVVTGVFSLVIGTIFLMGKTTVLPALFGG
jgi:hypothetical protein